MVFGKQLSEGMDLISIDSDKMINYLMTHSEISSELNSSDIIMVLGEIEDGQSMNVPNITLDAKMWCFVIDQHSTENMDDLEKRYGEQLPF